MPGLTESGAIVIAVIGALQAVTVAFISVLSARIGRVRKDASETREQISNDHEKNFREESDDRHDETRKWFMALWDKLTLQDRLMFDLLHRVSSLEDTRESLESDDERYK